MSYEQHMTDEQAVEESYPPVLVMLFSWLFNGAFAILGHPGCLLPLILFVVVVAMAMKAGGFVG